MSQPEKIQPFAVLAEVRSVECPTHGPYESRKSRFAGKDIWTGCPVCIAEVGAKQARAQELARRDVARKKVMERAAIPPRFANRTLENFAAECERQRHALQIATAFAEGFGDALANGRSMVFCGAPGTGKTHLAVGIAHELFASLVYEP